MTYTLDRLPKGVFCTIVADPPWPYGKWGRSSNRRSPANHRAKPLPYRSMSVDAIKALPVGQLAAANCDLYLWATQRYLRTAFGVGDSWGFGHCQTLVWCKKPRGTGQGGLYCPTTEFLLLFRRGKMPANKKRVDTTWWEVTRPHNKHSAKPEFFQDVIEHVSDPPRLELFARRKRAGWVVWGDEA